MTNMNLLVKSNNIILPVVGSLPTPNIWTWGWMGDNVSPATRQESQGWYAQQWQGMPNTRYALCLLTAFAQSQYAKRRMKLDDTPIIINLFRNGYGSRLDFRKIDVVLDQAEMIFNVGALLIPTLFNDDKTCCYADLVTHKRVIHQLVSLMSPYVRVWCIGLEVTEYLSIEALNTLYQIFKVAGAEIVGIHAQWDFDRMPQLPKTDVLFAELCNPYDGDNSSPAQIKQIGANVLTRCNQQGVACVFTEYFTQLNDHAKELSRALLELNPAGIGGPV